jgi:hypothetical protein
MLVPWRWHGKTAEHSFCLDFFASFFIKKKRRRKESFTPLFIEIKVKASVPILNQ